MVLATFYFQLHQPFRLNPDSDKFLWNERNKEIFQKVADKCYVPATKMFTHLLKENPDFKITISVSGTFLEQAEVYRKDVIKALQDLYAAGKEKNQIEFLSETYYHSLASLFEDPEKIEFRKQVSLHRQKLEDIFGEDAAPTSFRNTELMYNNEIATAVADMGYKSILCEKRDDMFFTGKYISPNAIFKATSNKGKPLELLVIPRNRELSDDVAYRFTKNPITADDYAYNISQISGEAVMMGYDYEHIGEHFWEDTGIFEFWNYLPKTLAKHKNIIVVTPREIAERFKNAECPSVSIKHDSTSSWADTKKDTFGWLGGTAQHALFKKIEAIEKGANTVKGELREKWRHLTTSDQVYYLHEVPGHDNVVHSYFSPYDGSATMAAHVLTEKVCELKSSIKHFQILKKTEKTPVILFSAEMGKLPTKEMGEFAQYLNSKVGGQAEIVSAIAQGLIEREIETYLVLPNMRKRFREEAGMSEEEYVAMSLKTDTKHIRLIDSDIYANNKTPYDGNPAENASEYQKKAIGEFKNIIKQYGGRGIGHGHDWFGSGIIAAYAKFRKIPFLQTVHNIHTMCIPIEFFRGTNLDKFENIKYAWDNGRKCVDSHSTGIANATKVSFVGKRFMEEIVEDYFMDRGFISPMVREEIKIKHRYGSAIAIPNGIPPSSYPENQLENPALDKPGLAKKFSENTNVAEAKKLNLFKFQKKTGLIQDPNSILFYWPSRLDPSQKGIELLEDIALKFVIEHPDIQIAVIGNGVGRDRTHEEIMGRIAYASNGKIVYYPFDEDLSILGYAAQDAVIGSALYAPFDLTNVVGNLFGGMSINRDTGGGHDNIINLELKELGAPNDIGNGVVYRNHDSCGFWYGLDRGVQHCRYLRNNPTQREKQTKRWIKDAKEKHSSENMIAGYLTEYVNLNEGKPLV